MDIDAERLAAAERVAHKVAEALGARPTIEARTRPPRGARRRGLRDQHVPGRRLPAGDGDRLRDPRRATGCARRSPTRSGIGGIMRGAAHHPRAARHLPRHGGALPRRLLLNYVNPMAMNCWALSARDQRSGRVGLCHSVQGTAEQLAQDIGVPVDEIDYVVRRHQPHGLLPELRARRREDLYPRIRQVHRRGPRARREPGALRDASAARLLRHRVERALRRVRALVHQARPART